MTDRQKFVYDLALQHVSAELANGVPLDKNPAAYALDIFTGYVSLYAAMDKGTLDAALATLQKGLISAFWNSAALSILPFASSSRTSRTVSRILISPYESSCSWHFARMSFARAFMLSSSMSLISFCISSLHVKQAGLARAALQTVLPSSWKYERVDFKSDKVKPRLIGCYAAASASKVSIEYLLPRLCIVF